MSRGIELAKTVWKHLNAKNFGQCLHNHIEIISAGNGNLKALFTVPDDALNAGGTLHGGYTSTLVDCISTCALMTHEKATPGVSVDLHVTFMKAAFPGETLTIDARTIRAGKTLAFLAVDLTKNDGKDVIAHGRHTKYVGERAWSSSSS